MATAKTKQAAAAQVNPLFDKAILRGLITSGSDTRVGKTSITRHGLKPFFGTIYDEVDFWGIEAAEHAQGVESKLFKPSDIKALVRDLRFIRPTVAGGRRCVLVDLGGDLFRELFEEMKQFEGGGLKFDFVVFPVTPVSSLKKFTTMLMELDKVGITANQIFLVYNKIPRRWVADGAGFKGMLDNSKQLKEIDTFAREVGINVSEAYITENTVVPAITDLEQSVDANGAMVTAYPELASLDALVRSDKDYEALANQAYDDGDSVEHEAMAQMLFWQEYAQKVAREYQNAVVTAFSKG